MKKLNYEKMNEIFNDFVLTCDELICVKGGEDTEPILLPNPPKIKI